VKVNGKLIRYKKPTLYSKPNNAGPMRILPFGN